MAREWAIRTGEWLDRLRRRAADAPVRIGVAFGGGFARGIAHVGVLRAFEREGIPVHAVAGTSAGSILAALYASGLKPHDIALVAREMKWKDVARWRLSLRGFADTERMQPFLRRLLRVTRFEQMQTALAVVATDLTHARPVVFRDHGDVVLPVRASCSYPGLFRPIEHEGRLLVDGAISMEVPAEPLREMGMTRVVGIGLPMEKGAPVNPRNLFGVVTRSMQILQNRLEPAWKAACDLVLTPNVARFAFDAFEEAEALLAEGEAAACAAMPTIRGWLKSEGRAVAGPPALSSSVLALTSLPPK